MLRLVLGIEGERKVLTILTSKKLLVEFRGGVGDAKNLYLSEELSILSLKPKYLLINRWLVLHYTVLITRCGGL